MVCLQINKSNITEVLIMNNNVECPNCKTACDSVLKKNVRIPNHDYDGFVAVAANEYTCKNCGFIHLKQIGK